MAECSWPFEQTQCFRVAKQKMRMSHGFGAFFGVRLQPQPGDLGAGRWPAPGDRVVLKRVSQALPGTELWV